MVIYKAIFLLFIIFIILYEFSFHNYLTSNNIDHIKNNRIVSSMDKNNKIVNTANIDNEYREIDKNLIQTKTDYTPKISVIITDYIDGNITECLDSVIKQTLKEIEIIYVVDEAKYNTINLLQNYIKKDKRITVLKHKNLNPGMALNIGLLNSKGKYLSFFYSSIFLDFKMLKIMYEEIEKTKSDIIICKYKNLYIDRRQKNEKIYKNTFSYDIFNKKNTFSAIEISKDIFQFIEGWTFDKLFRTEFILSNNIRFQHIPNFSEIQFTYLALCFATSIITTNETLVIKRSDFSYDYSKDPHSFISSFDKLKSNLQKYDFYNIVKGSFWKWALNLSLILLKNLDNNLKEYLYIKLHEKLKLLDDLEKYNFSSNQYKALHYVKFQNSFPTINIVYAYNRKNINLILLSIVSILKNSEYENINIILLYNDINQFDLQRINELKEINSFTLQTLYISEELFVDFPKLDGRSNEIWYKYILGEIFNNLDKILYLNCNTIIRKSLLPLWEINLNNKLIGAVEDISFSKEKAMRANLKDKYYINTGVLLINLKEWRKLRIFRKTLINIKKYNNIFEAEYTILNIITDLKKFELKPDYNYMEDSMTNITCQYNNEYLDLYNKRNPTILQYKISKTNILNSNSSFINDYLKYQSILYKLIDSHLKIPIVLSSDDKYAIYMYTAMISILKNKNKNTYYIFYLLVPLKFSKSNINKILSIREQYICDIHFINLDEIIFKDIRMHIRHITKTTYYRLLIGDLLPIEIDKCIYLDVDICVCKDLSELFNIELKDNYLAGVISPAYFFAEKRQCKRLNISSMKQYINAGMLIMNLKQIRKDKMTEKFIELTKKNYFAQDQDILNVACFGKIITLPPKYNAQVYNLVENNPLLRKLYSEKDIIDANTAPYIIHYSNKRKPWNSLNVYMEEFWWDIAKEISWFTRDNIYKKELIKLWSLKNKKTLNLEKPRTFDEKIQWLKIYDSTPIKTILSDKYLVRDWIAEKIGEQYIIPLLGTYEKFTDIDFEKLPNKFVIKCNHGNGYTIIVTEKSQLNLTKTKIQVDKWMNENYAFKSIIDLQFRNIKRKIIIEKYMDNKNEDYELLCLYGKPKLILIERDRNIHQIINILDLNSKKLSYKWNNRYYIVDSLEKRKYLEEMIDLAFRLSTGFIFVKVDFFIMNSKIYFNKMDFSTAINIEGIISKNEYRFLSSSIKLPKLAYNIDTGEYYELIKSFSYFPYRMLLITLICKLFYNIYIMFKKISFYF